MTVDYQFIDEKYWYGIFERSVNLIWKRSHNKQDIKTLIN